MNFRIALILVSFVTPVAKAESAAVDAFARPAVLGMQLAAKHAARDGRFSGAQSECMQALTPKDFYQVTEEVMNTSLTPSERAVADRFFASPAGQKFTKHNVLRQYSRLGEQPPEPPPQFSDADDSEIAQFMATSAGQNLLKGDGMRSTSAMQKFEKRQRELLQQCNAS